MSVQIQLTHQKKAPELLSPSQSPPHIIKGLLQLVLPLVLLVITSNQKATKVNQMYFHKKIKKM